MAVSAMFLSRQDFVIQIHATIDHPIDGNVAGLRIVLRGGDDAIDAAEEAVHQRLIESQQPFLPDDVEMLREHRGLRERRHKVHDVRERPRIVVVDNIGLSCQRAISETP